MTSGAPSLAELQDRFQRAILAGDRDSLLTLIPDSSRTTRDVLFGVYANAYQARLIEIVAADHPLLKTYAGEDMFAALARGYIAAHPSHTQNARWFSAALPDYLAEAATFSDRRELAELARLERTLNTAFDAPDAAPLTIAGLAAVPPDRWEDLVFSPHPSAARLDFVTNVFAIWNALKAEVTPPEAETLADPDRVLVWREDVTPRMRRLGAEEAMMWDEAAKGVRFGALCELLAVYDQADTAALRAAQYLQGWLGAGLLSDARSQKRTKHTRRILADC